MAPRQERDRQNEITARQIHGGFYPVGANNLWHTGLHISGTSGVRPIAPGKIIAARITNDELDANTIFKELYGSRVTEFPRVLKPAVDRARQEIRDIIENGSDFELVSDPEKQLEFYRLKPDNQFSNSRQVPQALIDFYCRTSNNFVLIEHELKSYNDSGTIKYYSLYMHLKALGSILDNRKKDAMEIFYKSENGVMPVARRSSGNDSDNKFNDTRSIRTGLGHEVDRNQVIGYPGFLPFQENVCHLEVFSEDRGILDLSSIFDPEIIDHDSVGEYYNGGNRALFFGYKEGIEGETKIWLSENQNLTGNLIDIEKSRVKRMTYDGNAEEEDSGDEGQREGKTSAEDGGGEAQFEYASPLHWAVDFTPLGTHH